MKINYIKDGEKLTGFKNEQDPGIINRPVYELAQYVQLILDYLKANNINIHNTNDKNSVSVASTTSTPNRTATTVNESSESSGSSGSPEAITISL